MKIRLRLFSIAKDIAGFNEETVELVHAATAGSVMDYLAGKNPRFEDWKDSVRLAVNQTYVQKSHPLSEGDEVAVIPPVSGG